MAQRGRPRKTRTFLVVSNFNSEHLTEEEAVNAALDDSSDLSMPVYVVQILGKAIPPGEATYEEIT